MGKVLEPHHSPDVAELLAWDHMMRGVRNKNHPFRNAALSTAGPDGPDSRMVVVRYAAQSEREVRIYTDARSAKGAQLRHSASAALLLWHPAARLQVKLKVQVVMHNEDAIAKQCWNALGVNSRKSYQTAAAPGTGYDTPIGEPAMDESVGSRHFTVLVCKVQYMELLQLNQSGHIRMGIQYNNEGVERRWLVG